MITFASRLVLTVHLISTGLSMSIRRGLIVVLPSQIVELTLIHHRASLVSSSRDGVTAEQIYNEDDTLNSTNPFETPLICSPANFPPKRPYPSPPFAPSAPLPPLQPHFPRPHPFHPSSTHPQDPSPPHPPRNAHSPLTQLPNPSSDSPSTSSQT